MNEQMISKAVEAVLREMNSGHEKRYKMTLAVAKSLIEKVEEKAKEVGVNAVIAVSDQAGRIVAVHCMDDAYIASYDIAVNKTFTSAGLKMSTAELAKLAQPGQPLYGIQHTNEGKIVIFAGGTGSPYFSTDTGAALRAAEIAADAILMAKNIDFVYDSDPRKNPDAKPLYDLTYTEILEKNLRAFDMSAVIFCRDNNIEAYGFGLADPENIYRAVMGEPVGTRMHN